MPIQLPNLDNRTFDELMKEMIASIPKYTKEWTNFNPSDVGITILELLAWVSESLIYRTNIVPEESYINFLRLVAGAGNIYDKTYNIYNDLYDKTDKAHLALLRYLKDIADKKIKPEIQSMKAEAQRFLSSRYRAVTKEDFKELSLEADSRIKRVDVRTSAKKVEIIMVIPDDLKEASELISRLRDYLEPRRLIGTVIEIKMAESTKVNLEIMLTCKSYVEPETIKLLVEEAITRYLDSINGGPNGKGWPYGRDLREYELFHLIEKIDGVKHVNTISVKSKSGESLKFPVKITGVIHLNSIDINIEEEGNE